MDTNLYTIKKHNGGFTITLSSSDHPLFKAHFEGNPILPGFIFLHICEKAMEKKIVEVIKSKFITFAKPEDVLELNITQKDETFYAVFERDGKKICMVTYKLFKE
jgi:3-hydroxymyristoyl/3-hydroxydecanoyl-(acyl carrier protein) dehydratase